MGTQLEGYIAAHNVDIVVMRELNCVGGNARDPR